MNYYYLIIEKYAYTIELHTLKINTNNVKIPNMNKKLSKEIKTNKKLNNENLIEGN